MGGKRAKMDIGNRRVGIGVGRVGILAGSVEIGVQLVGDWGG